MYIHNSREDRQMEAGTVCIRDPSRTVVFHKGVGPLNRVGYGELVRLLVRFGRLYHTLGKV